MEIKYMDMEKLKAAAELSDKTFRDEEQVSMAEGFPAIFSGAFGSSFGCYDGDRLVSFMGLVPHHIVIGPAKLPLYSIGSVCTDEAYRGKGAASLLLQAVFDHMEKARASLLYVSGDRQLYIRNGCRKFGDVSTYLLSEESVRSANEESERITVKEAGPADLLAVQSIQEGSVVRYSRSIYETAALLQAEAVAGIYKLRNKLLVAEIADEIVAYAVVAVPGKSKTEQKPFVVESGGGAETVRYLLEKALSIYSLAHLGVPVSWHEAEMHAVFGDCEREDGKSGGTLRVLNAGRLWTQLAPYLIERDEEAFTRVKLIAAEREDQHEWAASLMVDGDEVRLNRDELTALLFEPSPVIPALTGEKRALAERLLPVPLPYPYGLNFV